MDERSIEERIRKETERLAAERERRTVKEAEEIERRDSAERESADEEQRRKQTVAAV